MILPLSHTGIRFLRQEQGISEDYPKLKELIENMYETMYDSKGVGLTALK